MLRCGTWRRTLIRQNSSHCSPLRNPEGLGKILTIFSLLVFFQRPLSYLWFRYSLYREISSNCSLRSQYFLIGDCVVFPFSLIVVCSSSFSTLPVPRIHLIASSLRFNETNDLLE